MTQRLSRVGRALALGLAAFTLVGAAAASDDQRLRAAFVLRFAQYTQWSELPAGGQLQLCAAGLDGGDDEMRRLAGRNVGARVLQVSIIELPREAQACQVLVLGHDEPAQLRRWRRELGDAPVLVVGTRPEAWRAGVAIALLTEPQGLAFSINLSEARRRGLGLSAQMLKLAREVR